jgi:outer membrane immunogenic protein
LAVDHALIYVKGGGAWANDKDQILLSLSPFPVFNASGTVGGWMFGTGIEYAVTNAWSAKIEYDYLDLGTKTFTFLGLSTNTVQAGFNNNVPIRERVQLVKFGINYHFGGPVATRY